MSIVSTTPTPTPTPIPTSTSTSTPGTPGPRRLRRTATVVGILFVVQMVTAMFGTSLVQAFADGDTDRSRMVLGVLLMVGAGLTVVGIGLLMYPVLKEVNPRLAVWYPVLRIAEFGVSAACGLLLLIRSEVVPDYLLWVYLPTGLGGIVLTYLLLVSRLVPRAIALLGLVGYVALTVGVPLDLLGVLDLGAGPGLAVVVPGGLFEVIFLPAWLVFRGFRSSTAAVSHRPGRRW